jgi:hypothetical protein
MAHLYGRPTPAPDIVKQQKQQRLATLCEELLDAPSLALHQGALELTRLLGKTVTVDGLDDIVDVVLHESGALLRKADELDQRASASTHPEIARAYADRAVRLRKRDAAAAALPPDAPLGPRASVRANLLAKAESAQLAGQHVLAEGYRERASAIHLKERDFL